MFTEESKEVLSDKLTLEPSLRRRNFRTVESVTSDLVDTELLDEVKTIKNYENISLYFGKTLRDIKLVLRDDQMLREHKIFIKYVGPRKLVITSLELPQHCFQNVEYTCIDEVIQAISKHILDLSKYFHELELMDQLCTIMEPLNPSFKDDYRRIFLDDRTWLHLEVTLEGLATNIHLIGQSDYWTDKLQAGLLSWDHDKNIVENILTVFDLADFPQPTKSSHKSRLQEETEVVAETAVCAICLCEELPDLPGVPQPLCQNPMCGVYFHRTCLYQKLPRMHMRTTWFLPWDLHPQCLAFETIIAPGTCHSAHRDGVENPPMHRAVFIEIGINAYVCEWLVACTGSRPPAFGVASGACPTCLQPISCSEKDN